MSTHDTNTDAREHRGERRDDKGRVLDPEPLHPEPLDPEPLAVDSDDVEDFVEHFGDDERAIDTDAQPPQ